ncbi:HNH endonuclease [Candidatus Woesebacteria bacterium RIFCSPHIGHO2_01_FULL_39_17]|uniref:HNH endonuclease n=2 Tax=Microgenomates group TaxID=1794810 RepID=A0A0H4TAI7_9BACT|nr:hypothetical protein [uncultured Microgenomates bacterium Rifle_16ft_4_minimus_954]KKQ51905.1 MAG: hypothetical protein US72_C0011G0004 [Microgenomates group bacterium GW2011_GWC1_38_12]KKQ93886.1 MAG: hypothetical protein UT19_C0006G0014 [Candidatus Woesebacteria bacterium GW2011_GWB1_39_10b]OGM22328.1 MAG: HNH endonuclease [Candidatus Woesebacteria bacterium RIFCSPHIGHO2_01_FULL_39_17]
MKKLKLIIELVPASSWNQNLRSLLKPQMWEKLRKEVYKKHNYKCAICKSGGRLQAHEVWEYDDKNHIQKLVDLVALCSKCHAVKHIGLAGIQASEGKLNYDNLIKHFMKVNNCGRDVFEKHQTEAFKKFDERSCYEWSTDFSEYKSKK